MLSQTYDDIDLENEPWYKFFSELEFGRPVSQGRSSSHNCNSVVGKHPLSSPCRWFFNVSTGRLGGGACSWACDICWVLWSPPLSSHPLDRLCYTVCLHHCFLLVWQLPGTVMFIINLLYWRWFSVMSCPISGKTLYIRGLFMRVSTSCIIILSFSFFISRFICLSASMMVWCPLLDLRCNNNQVPLLTDFFCQKQISLLF